MFTCTIHTKTLLLILSLTTSFQNFFFSVSMPLYIIRQAVQITHVIVFVTTTLLFYNNIEKRLVCPSNRIVLHEV